MVAGCSADPTEPIPATPSTHVAASTPTAASTTDVPSRPKTPTATPTPSSDPCAAPFVTITHVEYASTVQSDYPDAVYPAWIEFAVKNSSQHPVRYYGLTFVIDLAAREGRKPTGAGIDEPGLEQELDADVTTDKSSTGYIRIKPGRQFSDRLSTYGAYELGTTGGPPPVHVKNLSWAFDDPAMAQACNQR